MKQKGKRMLPRHHHLTAAEGGGSGLSQDGFHLGLGFNEGGNCLQSDGCGGLGKQRKACLGAKGCCVSLHGGRGRRGFRLA